MTSRTNLFHLDAEAVHAGLPWKETVEALRAAHATRVRPTSTTAIFDAPEGGGDQFVNLTAWSQGRSIAVKMVGVFPANPQRATPERPALDEATLAFAEPGRRFRTDPALEAAGGKLSGAKTFVPCGGAADLFLVTARHEGRSVVFAVPRDAAGLTVQCYPVADGSHAAQLVLDGVAHGDPLAANLDTVIDAARIVAAAELVGLARRLLADTLEYVKTREQFGQPIGRFQVIQHRLVDAYARVEAAQSALYRALLKPGAPAVAVKGFIAEAAQWVGQQAVQLHGGMGMTDELAIGHGLKRIVLLGKLFGDAAGGIAAYGREAA